MPYRIMAAILTITFTWTYVADILWLYMLASKWNDISMLNRNKPNIYLPCSLKFSLHYIFCKFHEKIYCCENIIVNVLVIIKVGVTASLQHFKQSGEFSNFKESTVHGWVKYYRNELVAA